LGLDITFTTESNELHRRRRAPLNNFFSRRSVLDLEDLVQATAHKLCDRVAKGVQDGGSVDLGAALRALSVDVITKYAFDESWGQLDRDDLGAWWSTIVRSSSTMMLNFQQWPLLRIFMMSLPDWLGAAMDQSVADTIRTLQVRA
jgi:cytochrome P450